MANVTLQGNPIQTQGTLPAVGSKAPNFRLATSTLSDVTLDDYQGSKIILKIHGGRP